ncbi:MAG: hypothetical protein O2782_04640 [bacterium]|nr:hypothetical protein [bacterium]
MSIPRWVAATREIDDMLSSSRRTVSHRATSRFAAVVPWLLFTGGLILCGRILPALF